MEQPVRSHLRASPAPQTPTGRRPRPPSAPGPRRPGEGPLRPRRANPPLRASSGRSGFRGRVSYVGFGALALDGLGRTDVAHERVLTDLPRRDTEALCLEHQGFLAIAPSRLLARGLAQLVQHAGTFLLGVRDQIPHDRMLTQFGFTNSVR